MHQPAYLAAKLVGGRDDIARPALVNLVKAGCPDGFGGSRAMDNVRDVGHRLPQAFGVADRAGAHLNLRQVARDEPPIAGGPEQHDRGKPPVAEAIENMTADEAARPCEQDLQLDQAEFFAHLPQLVEGEIHLLVGVRCHQADADQLLPGRHRR